jgi:hypothetical protein
MSSSYFEKLLMVILAVAKLLSNLILPTVLFLKKLRKINNSKDHLLQKEDSEWNLRM